MTTVAEHPERNRIEQSNDVAGIVADIGQKNDVFMYLHLRYDIADALWAAGYRQTEPDTLHHSSVLDPSTTNPDTRHADD